MICEICSKKFKKKKIDGGPIWNSICQKCTPQFEKDLIKYWRKNPIRIRDVTQMVEPVVGNYVCSECKGNVFWLKKTIDGPCPDVVCIKCKRYTYKTIGE